MLVTEKQRKTVATEKTGHEVNAEKYEHMFISCEENVEEYRNIKVNNTPLCVDITPTKIKTAFANKLRAD